MGGVNLNFGQFSTELGLRDRNLGPLGGRRGRVAEDQLGLQHAMIDWRGLVADAADQGFHGAAAEVEERLAHGGERRGEVGGAGGVVGGDYRKVLGDAQAGGLGGSVDVQGEEVSSCEHGGRAVVSSEKAREILLVPIF
jgi:hypothetical protein